MDIQQSSKPIFLIGGKEFLTMAEAEEYKRTLEERLAYTYYTVRYSPDLTEGRGYYNAVNIAVTKGYTKNALIHYLVEAFGKPVVQVMGVSPMDNWTYQEGQKFTTLEDLDTYLNKKVTIGIGDYQKQVTLQTIYINQSGEPMPNQYNQ